MRMLGARVLLACAALSWAGCDRSAGRDPIAACIEALPEPRAGVTHSEGRDQAVAWGSAQLVLCDREMLVGAHNFWTDPTPPILSKRGIRAALFDESTLWLASGPDDGAPARVEALGFGPPTGMDGALQIFQDDHPISVTGAAPARLEIAGGVLRVIDVNGAVTQIDRKRHAVIPPAH